MIWARMLAYVTGMVHQELLLRNAISPDLERWYGKRATNWELSPRPTNLMYSNE
jgi:hypothetical protein